MDDIIYLDNNATTPLDPRVLEEMMPYLTHHYGNASSQHAFGKQTAKAVEHAREQVSDLIGAEPKEIIFTSGATEAINLAMKGLAGPTSKRKHIVTVATEHKAVLDVSAYLESIGFEVSYLPVQRNGLLDVEVVKDAIRKDTLLVSVMYVNNETGVIQPLKEIAEIAHAKGAWMMTDATQAVGKMPVDVDDLGIDLMAFSAHKFYGHKGIGGLFVRSNSPQKLSLEALLHGGGHEQGVRSGTLNVPAIIGMGKACELAEEEMESDAKRVAPMRDELEASLLEIPGSWVNGSTSHRLYNVTNVGFPGLDANVLIGRLPKVAMSNGSACTSAVVEPSHVLTAMGLTEGETLGSLRLSLGRMTDAQMIDKASNIINSMIKKTSTQK